MKFRPLCGERERKKIDEKKQKHFSFEGSKKSGFSFLVVIFHAALVAECNERFCSSSMISFWLVSSCMVMLSFVAKPE